MITAPTAAGKTEIAYTIAAWAKYAVNLLEPDNILVNQASERYRQFTTLHRRDKYPCLNLDHAIPGKPCRCKFVAAKRTATDAKMRLMNYWMYFLYRMHAPTLIFDEGHKVIELLHGFNNWTLLQSEFGFPSDLRTVAAFIEWAQAALESKPSEELEDAVSRVSSLRQEHGMTMKRRGNDLELGVEPLTASEFGFLLWPRKEVKKLVFMSATIGPLDMKELGLDSRRVAYLNCDSPIPAANRPLEYEPRYNLSHDCVPHAIPVLAAQIEALLAKHTDKGIIHVPYNLAGKLQLICSHPRLLYHDKKTKAAVLQEFKDSPPDSGAVLVASGLYEGVDLPYDAARWQLIAKVPFLSLADPSVELRAKHDADWYAWESIKRLLQAYGRIVRAPDDFGVSYIMDTSFASLYRKHKTKFPQFVRDAMKGIK